MDEARGGTLLSDGAQAGEIPSRILLISRSALRAMARRNVQSYISWYLSWCVVVDDGVRAKGERKLHGV
jgi:hypothetical protein